MSRRRPNREKDMELRVLIVEDSEDDAQLILRELRRGGYDVHSARVETAEAMRSALAAQIWDLIVCDYSLPRFNAPQALQVLKDSGKDLPFIIVSGSIGEDTAVAALKAGAHDFMIKDNPVRLVPAIQRELREAEGRRERKRAEDALHAAETRYRLLVERIPAITYVVQSGPPFKTLYISPQVEQILGFTPEEWMATPNIWERQIHPDDLERVLAEDRLSTEQNRAFVLEYRILTRDGRIIWLHDETNHFEEPGTAPFSQGIEFDITERRRAEEALQKSEQVLRQAEVLGHTGSWEQDLITGEIFNTPENLRLFFGDDLSKGGPFEDFAQAVHPDDREFVLQRHTELLEGGPGDIEYRVLWPDGSVHVIFGRATVVRDELGKAIRVYGTNVDVTERRQAEQALRDSEERYRLLFETNPLPMWVYDAESLHFLAVNEAAIRHYGYARDEFLRMTIAEIRPPGEVSRRVVTGLLPQRPAGPWRHRHRKKDGTLIDVEVIAHEVEFLHRPARLVLANDITERLQHERELEAVASISTSLRSAQTLNDMLPLILDQTLTAINSKSGSIWLYDPASDLINMMYQRGWKVTSRPLKRGEGVAGFVVASNEIVRSREFRTDPRVSAAGRENIPAGVGGACLPLRASNQTIGALFVNIDLPRELSDEDVRLLTALAEIAGNAIHRVRLFEQTVQQLERLAALRAIDITITSSLDQKITLNVVLDQVIKQLNVDAAAILLFGAETKGLRYAAAKGFRSHTIETTSLRAGEGLPARAVLDRKIIHIEDLKAENEALPRADLLADEKFVSYYAVPLIAKGKIKGVLEIFHRSTLAADTDWLQFLEALGNQAAIAIDNSSLFEDLQRSNLDLALAYDATIEGWSRALDLRDKETEGHTRRVTEMTLKLAEKVGLGGNELVQIRRGALLHDIGKMGVPDPILLKPDKLTDDEWVVMRKHPQYANEMLTPITYLRPALHIPYCHHEKWDGTGYPRGLKGEQIPLAARIFSIVDVWDALSFDRPYRPAWKGEEVLKYIEEQSGIYFDPALVKIFLAMVAAQSPSPKIQHDGSAH
jgi:PAS domain S-box-containing protein